MMRGKRTDGGQECVCVWAGGASCNGPSGGLVQGWARLARLGDRWVGRRGPLGCTAAPSTTLCTPSVRRRPNSPPIRTSPRPLSPLLLTPRRELSSRLAPTAALPALTARPPARWLP